MPTFIHDSYHKWLAKEFFKMHSSGFLSATEFKRLDFASNVSMYLSIESHILYYLFLKQHYQHSNHFRVLMPLR
jgi:hypothetical protein